jgi:hypothetical protein
MILAVASSTFVVFSSIHGVSDYVDIIEANRIRDNIIEKCNESTRSVNISRRLISHNMPLSNYKESARNKNQSLSAVSASNLTDRVYLSKWHHSMRIKDIESKFISYLEYAEDYRSNLIKTMKNEKIGTVIFDGITYIKFRGVCNNNLTDCAVDCASYVDSKIPRINSDAEAFYAMYACDLAFIPDFCLDYLKRFPEKDNETLRHNIDIRCR